MKISNRPRPWLPPKSAFAGYRFPPEVIVVAVRWYLRYNLSYRDIVMPAAWHHVEQHANNPIEGDHSQLKHRLRPMRGLTTDHTAQVVIAGHAFVQNVRRGHYELGVQAPPVKRISAVFTELARAI